MEQFDIKNKILNMFKKHKSDLNFSGFSHTKLLELIGKTLGTDKLDEIFEDKELLSLLANSNSFIASNYVFKFIEELIKTDYYKSFFDPWVSLSSPILYLQADNLNGTCINQSEFKAIKTLFKEKNINFKLGDTFNQLSISKDKYDLIISFPPFGIRTQDITGTKSQFDFATTLLLKCGDKIENTGKLIFIVSNNFLLNKEGIEALKKEGLFIEAVFVIPSGAFAPMTSISLNLILVSKNSKEKTFVAEISEDETINNTIIQNFKSQKEGKVVQLGTLIELSEFKSLNALVYEKEMQELVKRIGYPPILLTEISISINALKGDNAEEVEHLANSIYLPKIGNSPVVASLSELKIKTKNYYQIQLDETKANSIYVANYFNTPFGKKLRESLVSGAIIQQIAKSQLSKSKLFLPDLATQVELLDVDNKIQQFSFRLEELKRNLWKQPKNYKSIVKELKTINQEEKLENWIDQLPFPISSILWRYYATKNNSKKIEHLFHFFEAFSEFLSMLMLSALAQDKEFYKEESHKWIGKDEKFQNWYLRATFGNWNNLTSNLSKAIRTFLSENEKKEYCINLFGNPSEAFLSMITSKGIVNVLFEVANLRNKWKGHGGITSEEENNQRVLILEQQLNELRKYIADAFEDIKIISSAKDAQLEDGVWSYTARNLFCAKSPFREIQITTRLGLEKKKLYLINSEFSNPIPLLPFIKYEELNHAIYFYTSIESKYVRWVSYHFDKEAELTQPADNDLFKAFDFLKPDGADF